MITFHNTHLFTITPRIKVYFENLMAVYTVKNSLPFMQSKGLLQCLQWPVTGPSPEPNKSSCHSPNLFQICWKNQLLVPSCLSICLFKRKSTTCNRQLAMEKHNLQQTACYGKAQLATDSLLWNSTTCNRQLAMEQHNLQQTACCNILHLKLPQKFVTFKFWSWKSMCTQFTVSGLHNREGSLQLLGWGWR